MTFNNQTMEYRVTLDTDSNEFIVISTHDASKAAKGLTIQEAVSKLQNMI